MKRPCPLCNASEIDIIKQILYKDINYIIGKCKKCNFVYVKNPDFNTVSNDNSANIAEISIPDPKKRHFQIEKLINTHYKEKETKKVLEIGSGYGSLAKMLSDKAGYDYIGFEPNDTRYQVCQHYNLNVKNCFFSSNTIDSVVDAIVIDNVLEHLVEPRELIEEAAKVLDKNGMIIVIVPNFQDIRQLRPSWNKRHFWQPSCHINYFTGYHLKKLFQENDISFHPFGLSSLTLKKDWAFLPKVVLDSLSIYQLGLYCYGIKN